MKTKRLLLAALMLLSGSLISAYSQSGMHEGHGSNIHNAICMLYSTEGNSVSGTVTFEKIENGMKVLVDVHGLTPGKHGFHIHEFGDCSSKDAASAGGHFNPAMVSHGGPMDQMRHEGDMGNIVADQSGNAKMEYTDPKMTFEGSNSIIGRSIIVHASEDDLKTQPTGNSGARIACGVIGVAKN